MSESEADIHVLSAMFALCRLMNISTRRSYLRNSFMSRRRVEESGRLFAYRRRNYDLFAGNLRIHAPSPRR